MHSVLSLPGPMSSAQSHFTAVDDPRTSVAHLLARASTYPCSAATAAFSRLAHPTTTFQLALDALLPALDPPTPGELADRILVSFILFALYAPHPITINPFKSVLFMTFLKEREQALAVASTGGVAPNEPLVWVLWKILKGDGEDIGPYSPSALARSLLPPNFRATKLNLDDTLYHTSSDLDDIPYSYEPQRRAPPHSDSLEDDELNEAVAHAMRLLLAARTRVLTLSEQRQLTPQLSTLAAASLIAQPDLAPLAAKNPGIAAMLFASLLSGPAGPAQSALIALAELPPTLATFDVLGRLLRDATPAPLVASMTTVGELVRHEAIGPFVAQSVGWLEQAEREEREGLVSDDRFAQGVQHLCRFYHSLIKLGLVDLSSDTDTAAMTHFSLLHARFEEANALYRTLAAGRAEF